MIKSWQKFAKEVRSNGCNLLNRLDEFPDSVLVSGCQRSGGTMLANIFAKSEGMVDFAWSSDDELDAALILSGYVDYSHSGRHCFQTTYLNECYHEYFEHKSDYKIIWLLRNPYSVVYSLLHNWKRFALNELFVGCGRDLLQEPMRSYYERFGLIAVSRLHRACLSYNAKISQVSELINILGDDKLMVVDYDDLILKKEVMLPKLYDFIGHTFHSDYSDAIRISSIDKARKLSARERKMIHELCEPVYNNLKVLAVEV